MEHSVRSRRQLDTLHSRSPYLDGLRGLLSLAVMNSHLPSLIILGYDRLNLSKHHLLGSSGSVTSLASPNPGGRNILDIPLVASCVKRWGYFTIPGLKLLYSGKPAVAMFFCISGYLASRTWVEFVHRREMQLGIGPVPSSAKAPPTQEVGQQRVPSKECQEREQEQRCSDKGAWLTRWSASLFNRPVRILLLSALSMIPSFVLVKLNKFSSNVPLDHNLLPLNRDYRFGLDDYALLPLCLSSWRAQGLDLLEAFKRLVCVFASKDAVAFNVAYNPVLWTVKYDARAWLVLVAIQASLLHVRRRWRLAVLGTMTAGGLVMGSLDVPLFLGGCMIAEMHQAEDNEGVVSRSLTTSTSYKNVLLGFGLYLLSYPSWQPSRAPQFALLRSLKVAPRTWNSLGAMITLYSLRDSSCCRRLLETRLFQWLGRHSFSIYLTHIPVLLPLGPLVFERAWKLTGHENTPGLMAGFSIAYGVLLASVLSVAAGWKACVEERVTRWVHQLYTSVILIERRKCG